MATQPVDPREGVVQAASTPEGRHQPTQRQVAWMRVLFMSHWFFHQGMDTPGAASACFDEDDLGRLEGNLPADIRSMMDGPVCDKTVGDRLAPEDFLWHAEDEVRATEFLSNAMQSWLDAGLRW